MIKVEMSVANQRGFTIQEMLVVIIVSSLLVSLCLSLFLFSSKLYKNWERKTELTIATERTSYVLAMDIQRARKIELTADSTLVLDKGTRAETMYRFERGKVLRDGISVVADSTITMAVGLQPQTDMQSIAFTIEGRRGGASNIVKSVVAAKASGKAEFKNSNVETP